MFAIVIANAINLLPVVYTTPISSEDILRQPKVPEVTYETQKRFVTR